MPAVALMMAVVVLVEIAERAVLADAKLGGGILPALSVADRIGRVDDSEGGAAADLALRHREARGVGAGPGHLDGDRAIARLDP